VVPIVPTLTTGEERDPTVLSRQNLWLVGASAIHVGDGVHGPSGVKGDDPTQVAKDKEGHPEAISEVPTDDCGQDVAAEGAQEEVVLVLVIDDRISQEISGIDPLASLDIGV